MAGRGSPERLELEQERDRAKNQDHLCYWESIRVCTFGLSGWRPNFTDPELRQSDRGFSSGHRDRRINVVYWMKR